MNISIKNIQNCNKLDENKLKNLITKLKLKPNENYENYENYQDYNDPDNKIKICNLINKKVKEINPCGIVLYSDTNLNLKKHQLNVSNHLINNRGIVVVHSVGTGKTLSAIATGQCLLINKYIDHIIVITPTSLQNNFISQAKMYGISDEEIDSNYTFYTIQGIVNSIDNHKVINPTNSLIIIDEAHNLRTLGGSRFETIFKYSKKASKIMLLTATPLINYNYDIINLVALVKSEPPISIDTFNKMIESKNKNEFENYVENIFSFHYGSGSGSGSGLKNSNTNPDPNFPSKKILEIFLPMEESYYKTYMNVENGQVNKIPDFKDKNINVFYNGLRRASNILEKKSPKVDWIIDKLNSDKNGKFVIFSHFINMGIKPVMKWLDQHKVIYGHVTGDLSIESRNVAVQNYNNNKIKILFISKAGSEGLDLKNTSTIIIMESSWNENSIEQIIGRGVRYKSHDTMIKSKRIVTIYRLYCVKPTEYKAINKIINSHLLQYKDEMLSVDLYLRNYSWEKQQKLILFEKLLNKYKIEN